MSGSGIESTVDGYGDAPRVAIELSRADEEMQAAIDSFRRARRMRLFEVFRPANTDPEHHGTEEVHVSYGITALLRAERHVSDAAQLVDGLPAADPTRLQLGGNVERLDDRFRHILSDLQARPNPRRIVSQLKRARKFIPGGLVRQLSDD